MFFFKQKTAYEMRISDWSSDVCSSDLDCERSCARTRRCLSRRPRLSWSAATGPAGTGLHERGGAAMIRQTKDGNTDIFETEIDGETIQWDNGLTYARHIQTQQLLSAQVPVSAKPDEMLFIIMHQTMEIGRASCRERWCQYV